MNGFFTIPPAVNEPVYAYAPGSPERAHLKAALAEARAMELDVPMYIGGQEVRTGQLSRMAPPHDHAHTLGHFHVGDASHVHQAIQAAMAAKPAWEAMPW
ncbi:MAG: 1-pyrroline-5-carboxylate dehydrogenase, partial [Bacteroidia bacterium]